MICNDFYVFDTYVSASMSLACLGEADETRPKHFGALAASLVQGDLLDPDNPSSKKGILANILVV